MGLDVTAYRNITLQLFAKKDAGNEPEDPAFVALRMNGDFPEQFDDLADGGIYSYAESEAVIGMPYGAYNRWRDQLAKIAGYELGSYKPDYGGAERQSYAATVWKMEKPEGPFAEQINFSDCEGSIGPKTSAKLLADYETFDAKARAEDGEFYRAYQAFAAAFRMAADGGAVKFH